MSKPSSSRIRPLAPPFCPQCQAERSFTILADRMQCRRCGFSLPREGQPTQPPPTDPRAHLRPTSLITHQGEVNPRARSAFITAQIHIERKEWDEAASALHRCLEVQRNFVDANLWLALLTDDPVQKRRYLSEVLAQQADHATAMREIMVLNGDLTPEQARALDNPYLEAQRREAGGEVGIETENLRCAVCGSTRMTVDELTGRVVCESCGTLAPPQDQQAGAAPGSLTLALLRRRTQAVKWVVGEHLLACESCGAQRTIPAQQLSSECPFCASKHIIERDVLDSFQQPDGMIAFRVSQDAAAEEIKARLGGWQERLRGLFDDNSVMQTHLEAVFLPFWVFDAMLEIQQTTVQLKRQDRYEIGIARPLHTTTRTSDAVDDVAVCAVKSPPPLLTRRLGAFNLREVKPYDSRLLARYTAELYSIDFDEASMSAREIITRTMRQKYAERAGYDPQTEVRVMPFVKQMQFQLVLLPVWVATIHEADGDVRTALVNGQTGAVVMGKPRKPRFGKR